ncbi:hypothetical protein Hanom_Chr08g00723981 [Helianthus anomalus]
MGLVSNPDTCWLPIQRDGDDTGVQVWDRRQLDMNSKPGTVWYPRQQTGSPTTPFGPPTHFSSPHPQFDTPSTNLSSTRPVTQLVGHFGSPPILFGSPPNLRSGSGLSRGPAFRSPPSTGVSERAKGKQVMAPMAGGSKLESRSKVTQVWVLKVTTADVSDPDYCCVGTTDGSYAHGFSWASDCDSDLDAPW